MRQKRIDSLIKKNRGLTFVRKHFLYLKLAFKKLISFFPFFPRFKKELKTPYISLYYPLRASLVSVDLRFMGVLLIFLILIYLISVLINIFYCRIIEIFLINFMGGLFLISMRRHIDATITHVNPTSFQTSHIGLGYILFKIVNALLDEMEREKHYKLSWSYVNPDVRAQMEKEKQCKISWDDINYKLRD